MAAVLRNGRPSRTLRAVVVSALRRWSVHHGRFALLLLPLLILLLSAPLLCWVWFSFYYDARPPLDSALAPPMYVESFPFRDLCVSARTAHTSNRKDNTAPATKGAAPTQERPHRLRRLPADGGEVGLRWAQTTGLPLPADRRNRAVAARFVTLSTRTDDFLQASTTAAAMAGVSLDVIGLGWTWFSFIRRMEIVRSFLDLANVAGDDVVVVADVDALWSGESVEDALAAFVASTAASAAEHATYRVRDIREGRRQPPVLFGAEYNCMHAQAYPSRHLCSTGYDVIDAMMASWAQQEGVPLPAEHRRTNPFRFLNAGVVVARAWALRRVWAAASAFMKSHTFYAGEEWWCDQSVFGSLYLQLRWWELRSGLLKTAAPATPHALSEREKADCLFAPLVLPDAAHGPHGLPGGLIGLDHVGRFSVVISMQVERKYVLQVSSERIGQTTSPDAALTKFLDGKGQVEVRAGALLTRSPHRVELVFRPGFDCAHGGADKGAAPLPECAYRHAVLGLPNATSVTAETDAAVAPLMWHFAGKYKRLVLTRFRTVFPWYTPMLWQAAARTAVLDALAAAPPTRLWYLNETTDSPFENVVHALYPHDSEDDVSFAKLCALSDVRQTAKLSATR